MLVVRLVCALPIAFVPHLRRVGQGATMRFLLMHADRQHAVAVNVSVDRNRNAVALDRSVI
eukprot:13255127-Alexandrium_andersonii.AAC.1